MRRLAQLVHRGERQAGRRRHPRDHPGHRPHRLGRPARAQGAGPAHRARRACSRCNQPGLAGVPAGRRGRRHRPVELPGPHADRLDRLRAGRRQRRGLQAVRAHPRRSAPGWSTPSPRWSRSSRCCSWSPGSARPARRCAGRGVGKLAFTGSTATGTQGHGRLRRDPDPGADRVRRQGRAGGGRGRRPRRGRRRRGVGRRWATPGRPASASSGSTWSTRSTTSSCAGWSTRCATCGPGADARRRTARSPCRRSSR